MRITPTSVAAVTVLMTLMTACESTKPQTPPAPAPTPAAAAATTAPAPAPVGTMVPTSQGPVFTTTQLAGGPLSVEDSIRAEVTARVSAINHATREVTLEGPSGRAIRFIAGSEIQRLGEIRVGDMVRVEYVASLLAELRPPTPAESADPIATVEVAGRAGQGSTPAGGAVSATRVVTTVEAIDIPQMRVILRGPLGDMTSVKARNPENIRKLRVGDTIVIFFTEGVGVSLVKTSGG